MEMADLLALVCDVYCDFVTFPYGIQRQMWYLVVSIPDPCCLSFFGNHNNFCFEKVDAILSALTLLRDLHRKLVNHVRTLQ